MEGDEVAVIMIPHNIISIHSLRMEGDGAYTDSGLPARGISIHSLRMEGDILHRNDIRHWWTFQSTPSAWRETTVVVKAAQIANAHFNPLPPHGGRPESTAYKQVLAAFQSTPSAWRETLL